MSEDLEGGYPLVRIEPFPENREAIGQLLDQQQLTMAPTCVAPEERKACTTHVKIFNKAIARLEEWIASNLSAADIESAERRV